MVVRVLEEVHDEAHHLAWSLLVNCTQSTDTQGKGLQCVCVCGGGVVNVAIHGMCIIYCSPLAIIVTISYTYVLTDKLITSMQCRNKMVF